MEYKETIIPANKSADSIKNVIGVLFITSDHGLGAIDTEHLMLIGSVEEKLAQYKAHTGKDWEGFEERAVSELIVPENVSLGLGQPKPDTREVSEETRIAQDKIDILTRLAKAYSQEDKIRQQRKKILETRERIKQEQEVA